MLLTRLVTEPFANTDSALLALPVVGSLMRPRPPAGKLAKVDIEQAPLDIDASLPDTGWRSGIGMAALAAIAAFSVWFVFHRSYPSRCRPPNASLSASPVFAGRLRTGLRIDMKISRRSILACHPRNFARLERL
jgi:hypothetical protein